MVAQREPQPLPEAKADELRGLAGCPAFDVRGETIVMATLGPDEQARLAGMPSILAELDADHRDVDELVAALGVDLGSKAGRAFAGEQQNAGGGGQAKRLHHGHGSIPQVVMFKPALSSGEI